MAHSVEHFGDNMRNRFTEPRKMCGVTTNGEEYFFGIYLQGIMWSCRRFVLLNSNSGTM